MDDEKTIIASNRLDDKTVVFSALGERKRIPWGKVYVESKDNDYPPFELIEDKISCGRDSNNHIVLVEDGISRNHFEIIKDGGQIILRDLKSTHGTIVNGESVKECSLEGSDIIDLGTVKLEYISFNNNEATVKLASRTILNSSRYKKSKKVAFDLKGLQVTSTLVKFLPFIILISSVFAAGLIKNYGAKLVQKEEIQRVNHVRTLWKSSMAYLQKKDLQRATQFFDQVQLQIRASIFLNNYRNFFNNEQMILKRISLLKDIIDSGNLERAVEEAAKLPKKTIFKLERSSILNKLEELEVRRLSAEFDNAYMDRSIEGMEEIYRYFLDKFPNKSSFHESFADRLDETYRRMGLMKKKKARARRGFKRRQIRLYESRKFDAFKRTLRDSNKKLMVEELKNLFIKGTKATRARNYQQAFSYWNTALKLDYKITKSRTSLSALIKKQLSGISANIGMDMLKRRLYEDASMYFSRSIRYNSKNLRAKEGLAQLNKIAQKNYKEAYIIYNSYGFSKKKVIDEQLDFVLKLTRKNSSLHQKARKLKARLKNN